MPDNVLIASDITVELGSAYVGSAYSPQASVTQTDTGWELTITYADPETPGELATLTIPVDSAGFGEVTASVESGHGTPQVVVTESGPDTAKSFHFAFSGIGGFSPTITVTEIEHGHRVTVTDVDGTESFDVLDGDPSQAIEDAERAAALANAAAATADTSAAAADTATAAAQTATTAAQTAASAAQTATANANTATGRANTAATSATSAASAAQTATTAAQTATTAADTAADNAQDAADRANAAAAGITDAYSPMFTAGAADGVTGGGPSDTAAWMYRTCPGTDGPAKVESIHGRTLVWNQLANGVDTATTVSGLTKTIGETGGLTVSGTVTTAPSSNALYIGKAMTLKRDGTKYLFKVSKPVGCPICVNGYSSSATNGTAFIWYNTSGSNWWGGLCAKIQDGDAVSFSDVHVSVFNLTQMFGSGNEPSTVAEFESMFPDAYYPYDAGSLLSVQMTGIETTDSQGNALMTRPVPAATYFPDGMRSAGSVYDELTESAAVTRIAAVDLGTLNWSMNESAFYVALTGKAVGNFNLLCQAYPTSTATTVANMGDKEIKGNAGNATIYVKDSSYSTAAAFKAAMSGVMLHYALATPTTTTIEPPLNMTYKAAAGGTERIVHADPTAAPTLAVTYGSTPAGIVASALAAIADPDGPTATATHAVGTYLTMDGKLYRVTTAIAIGETITPGTNVTATTVMAEVLALVQ